MIGLTSYIHKIEYMEDKAWTLCGGQSHMGHTKLYIHIAFTYAHTIQMPTTTTQTTHDGSTLAIRHDVFRSQRPEEVKAAIHEPDTHFLEMLQDQVHALNALLPENCTKRVAPAFLDNGSITIARDSSTVSFRPSSTNQWEATAYANDQDQGSLVMTNADQCWSLLLTFLVPSLRCVLHLKELLHMEAQKSLQVSMIRDPTNAAENVLHCEVDDKWVNVKLQGEAEDVVFWSSVNEPLRVLYPALGPMGPKSLDNPLLPLHAAVEPVTEQVAQYNTATSTLALTLLYLVSSAL